MSSIILHQAHADFGQTKALSYIISIESVRGTPQEPQTPLTSLTTQIDAIELPIMPVIIRRLRIVGFNSLFYATEAHENRRREAPVNWLEIPETLRFDDLEAQMDEVDIIQCYNEAKAAVKNVTRLILIVATFLIGLLILIMIFR